MHLIWSGKFMVLICAIHQSFGSIAIEPADSTIEHDGHCFERSNNIGSMQKDQEVQLEGQCVLAKCTESKDVLYISCGLVVAFPPCTPSDLDLSKPYPECCTKIQCS